MGSQQCFKICKVEVPATSANIGSGFDVFGIALSLHSFYSLYISPEAPKLQIKYYSPYNDPIPLDDTNIAYIAMKKIVENYKEEINEGIRIEIENYIPVGKGLGSSSSAVIGGLMMGLAYLIHKKKLPKENINTLKEKIIMPMAIEIEKHPDNVVPALFGGFTIANQNKYIKIIPKLKNISFVFVIPKFNVYTNSARKLIPENIPLKDAVSNIGYASALVYGFLTGDEDAIAWGLNDRLHQPYRRGLYGKFAVLLEKAKEIGAIGAFVSGSGPAISLLVKNQYKNSLINQIQKLLETSGVKQEEYEIKELKVNLTGSRFLYL